MKLAKEKKIVLIEIFIILFLSGFMILKDIHKGSLTDWDESMYAERSKQMLISNNPLYPSYDNQVDITRPTLVHLLTAINFKFLGISTLSARILPAILGVLSVLMTFFLAQKLFNHKAAFISSLVLLTSNQFTHYSKMLMADIPLTFFIICSMYFYVLSKKHSEKSWPYYLTGIFIGLAIMTKSVAGLIPLFIILIDSVLDKNKTILKNKNYLKVLIALLIVALPWHLILLIKFKSVFIKEYFGFGIARITFKAVEGHDYGDIYYIKVLMKSMGIWFYLLMGSLLYALYKIKDKELRLCLIWIFVTTLASIAVRTKLPWHIIFIYPGMALLIGGFLGKFSKFNLGIIIAVIAALLSFQIPQVLDCNPALSNIYQIAGGNIRVHQSIKKSPAQLFYTNSIRYPSKELTNENTFYLTDKETYYKDFANSGDYGIIYSQHQYVLFSRITKQTLKTYPEVSEGNAGYCYRYMPMNLEI